MFKQVLFLLAASSLCLGATLRVEPRILVKVGEKCISSVGLKKRMDFIFQHQYPAQAKNENARYDFYKNGWQDVLRDMIQTEMVLADVAEKEEKANHKMISDGDLHRELHDRFGPDVNANLASIGMTFKDGCQMLAREMRVGNMLYMNVQDKVKKQVRPEDIRGRYDKILASMRNKTKWRYQVVTISSEQPASMEKVALLAHQILEREGTASLTHLDEKTKTAASIQLVNNEEKLPEFKVSVSSMIETGNDDIDPERAKILNSLEKGKYSEPLTQKMRKSNKPVKRIFVLHEKTTTPPPTFSSCQERLFNEVAGELHQKETGAYMQQLEERFPVEVLFENSYSPFTFS